MFITGHRQLIFDSQMNFLSNSVSWFLEKFAPVDAWWYNLYTVFFHFKLNKVSSLIAPVLISFFFFSQHSILSLDLLWVDVILYIPGFTICILLV